MLYCTKCGSNLKGSKGNCPTCGYEVIKMKMDLSKPREVRSRPAEDEKPKPWAPPIPDQRGSGERRRAEPRKPILERVEEMVIEEPPKPKLKVVEIADEEDEANSDPRYVDGCSICGTTPLHRCFFTLAPLCDRHTVYMQIYIRGMAFGEKVPSAPEIASAKEGRAPTQAEAQEAGMFFAIKPYHEWKRVRR